MESKWSRLRMILTVTCGKDCYQCHTSLDLGDADDILLRVFQAVSSKGSDQADVILNLIEYYDIVDQTFAVCCDTPTSNIVYSQEQLCCFAQSWTLPSCGFPAGGTCWQYTSLTSLGPSLERRPRPPGGCVSNFRRSGQQSRMRLKTLQVGPPLYKIASEALQFGKRALTLEY